jgi:ankyrin repeat protein
MNRKLALLFIAAITAFLLASCASVEVRAVRQGDLQALQDYIAGGGDPNAIQNDGQSLLHIAVQYDQYQSLIFLLDNGAFADPQNRQGATPLHLAVGKGRTDMMEALLGRGADINRLDYSSQNMLFYAARSGRDNTLDLLLDRGVNPRQTDSQNRTPLHLLDRNNRRAFASRLLEAGTDPFVKEATNGELALHVAARAGAFELVDLYINTAGTGIIPIENNRGSEALFLSLNPGLESQQGFLTMEILLENGSDPNEPGEGQVLPIIEAVEKLDAPRVELLLQYGARTDVRLENNATLLHLAVDRGDVDLALLFLRYGSNPNMADSSGRTPIFSAAAQSDSEMFQLLLEFGADFNRYDLQNITPFTLALDRSARLSQGLSDQATLMNGSGGVLTPDEDVLYGILIRGIDSGNLDVVNLLFARGLDPDYRDDQGRTLLTAAVQSQQTEIVRILLLNQASVDPLDNDRRTPLMYASEGSNVDIVRILLQAGANVYAADRDGNSAIHYAARNGYPEPMRAILLAGSDPNLYNRNRQTPWELAENNPRRDEIREVLRLAGAFVPETPAEPAAEAPAETVPNNSADASDGNDQTAAQEQKIPPVVSVEPAGPAPQDPPPAAEDDAKDDDEGNAQPARPDIRLSELFPGENEPRGLSGARIGFEGYANRLASQYPRNMVSRDNNQEVQLYLLNDSNRIVEIFFIRADGSPSPVYRLEPGFDVYLETRQGNTFVFYGADGSYFGDISTTGVSVQGYRFNP